jgi:hAT family C-terminal dimerisation region
LQEAAIKLKHKLSRSNSYTNVNTKSIVDRCIDLVRAASPNDPTLKIDTLNFWFNLSNVLPKFYMIIILQIKEYSKIKTLAFEIFSVPASSAPIERIFSHASFATARHRSNTKTKHLNNQLMIYLNRQLI